MIKASRIIDCTKELSFPKITLGIFETIKITTFTLFRFIILVKFFSLALGTRIKLVNKKLSEIKSIIHGIIWYWDSYLNTLELSVKIAMSCCVSITVNLSVIAITTTNNEDNCLLISAFFLKEKYALKK